MRTIKTDDAFVLFKDDRATKDAVFQAVLDFFVEHEVFDGESIQQSDDPIIEAPVLLSTIADKIICFDITYN